MNELKIVYENAEERSLSYKDFQKMEKTVDISKLDPNKEGKAVYLADLLENCNSKYISLIASTDNFSASTRAQGLLDLGLIIYEKNNIALNKNAGGPFRFYIPNPKACKTDELDECVNVKYLDRIVLSEHIGKDSRPSNQREHHELHEKQN